MRTVRHSTGSATNSVPPIEASAAIMGNKDMRKEKKKPKQPKDKPKTSGSGSSAGGMPRK
jgi:hypothetical protein